MSRFNLLLRLLSIEKEQAREVLKVVLPPVRRAMYVSECFFETYCKFDEEQKQQS